MIIDVITIYDELKEILPDDVCIHIRGGDFSTEGSEIYDLNGVIVSDSHIVKYNDKWLPVSEHPDSIKLTDYREPFLYCLNTSSKIIEINDICFTDWDEIYDDNIGKLQTLLCFKFNNCKQKGI